MHIWKCQNKTLVARCWWLSPVILPTQEAAICRTEVQSKPRQIVNKTLSQKNPSQKRAGRVAQGVGPDSSPSTKKPKNLYNYYILIKMFKKRKKNSTFGSTQVSGF
jgi:hypothetical protein